MGTQPRKKRMWILLVVLIALVVAIGYSFMGGNSGESIDRGEFLDGLGWKGNVDGTHTFAGETEFSMIIIRGNTVYILTADAPLTKQNAFKGNPSANAELRYWTSTPIAYAHLLDDFRVWQKDQGQEPIYFDDRNTPTNVMDYVMPVLYLLIIGGVLFFVWRNMSSRSGLGNMGRHRATRILGGNLRFTDVAGIDEEKEEVQEIVDFLRNPKKFLDLGARIPKGFLLVGAPGTGKTLLAKAIAGEANVPFLSISGSDFSEMLVGVGPSRMRDLFEEAKLNAPCIIFIDEIDSIARMRGVGVSGVSDENEQTLNQLLVQMDGFTKSEGVIVLAATNRPDVLDQALLRPGRFDRQIVVQMPDVRGREKILEVHCRHKPIGTDVDLKRVAKIISGFTGADIENLMNEAAIIAAKKNKLKINMADITEGINKVLLGPQKRSRIITDEDKKITAFHEAGHAVISRILQPTQMVQEVSIIPRGMAAGYTITNEKDTETHHKSRAFLKTQISMCMGGRLAEELFIGDVCTGSTNDLKYATYLAENMVTKYGMSEKLGPLYYGKHDEIALRMYESARHSEVLQSTIDNEIKALVLAAEKTARDILKANSSKVKVMANVLLERETIYTEDIDVIMNGKDEKTVILEMEKREKAAKAQEKKDRTESDLVGLEQRLSVTMATAGAYLESKLIDLETMVKLEENMRLARDIVSNGGKLDCFPTLDNIENYANLVKAETKAAEKASAEKQPAKNPPAKKSPAKKPPQKGTKKDEKSPPRNT